MTNILELLKNEKVEWKKLGEVCEFINGFAFKSSLFSQSGEAVIRITNINSGKVTFDDLKYIKLDDYPELDRYKVEKNNILVAMSGATTGKIGYQYEDRIGYLNQRVGKFIPDESKVKRRFLFHFLYNIESELFSLATGSGAQPNLSSEAIKKIDIPIPSLEIQERIVKILDKFTNYVTELQSELQSRTKQYTYYRDKLLSEEYLTKVTKEMEEDRRLKIFKLDEIFDFKNGLNKGKEFFGKGVPFISYVNVYKLDRLQEEDIVEKVDLTEDEIERFSVIKGDVLFTRTSEVKEEVGYSSVVIEDLENTVFNGFTIRARLKNKDLLLPEYSAHLFRCYEIRKEIVKRSAFTTRASLSGQELGKVKVVIPPLSLQNKIVKVLDKFQLLLADTKGLIPEEIEQRQKQYEYYREKLLTFDVECDSTHARTAVVTNNYYDILREAAKYVGIILEDKVIEYRLRDIAEYSSRRIPAEELDAFNYVGVDNLLKDKYGRENSEYVPQTGSSIKFEKGNILIGNIRPYLRKIWYSDRIGGTNGDVLAISLKDKKLVDSRYLYHTLADERFFEYNIKYSKGAKMPRGDKKKIMDYKIPIPPLHVQQHVVNILDKFDNLVNDIKEGLPKEIEQRQKQYEYWRECLLNFPR